MLNKLNEFCLKRLNLRNSKVGDTKLGQSFQNELIPIFTKIEGKKYLTQKLNT